jgi:hypothetical protein
VKITHVSGLCALLWACACAGDANARRSDAGAVADAATTPEVGDSGPDASTRDAASDANVDAAATTGAAGGAWMDAFAAMNAALCECGFGPRGYDSAAQCAATEGSVDPSLRECAGASYAEHAAALGAGFDCQRAAVRGAADCYTASACDVDALNACDASLNMARRDCAAVPDAAIGDFFGSIGECSVGTTSVCPGREIPAGALGDAVASGSTFGQGDDFLGSCGTGPAPDVALTYTATEAGSYRFDTHGSSFDTELVAYDDCTAARELGCAEDDGERYSSELLLTLEAGQRVLLVVDGFDGTSTGDFVLNVSRR